MKKLELNFAGWQRMIYADELAGDVTSNIESMKLYTKVVAAGDASPEARQMLVDSAKAGFRKQLLQLSEELNSLDFDETEVTA